MYVPTFALTATCHKCFHPNSHVFRKKTEQYGANVVCCFPFSIKRSFIITVNMENTITDYVMHSLRGNSGYILCVCWLDTKEKMTALLRQSIKQSNYHKLYHGNSWCI